MCFFLGPRARPLRDQGVAAGALQDGGEKLRLRHHLPWRGRGLGRFFVFVFVFFLFHSITFFFFIIVFVLSFVY